MGSKSLSIYVLPDQIIVVYCFRSVHLFDLSVLVVIMGFFFHFLGCYKDVSQVCSLLLSNGCCYVSDIHQLGQHHHRVPAQFPAHYAVPAHKAEKEHNK